MAGIEVIRFLCLVTVLLILFAIFCYLVGYHDAKKKMKGGGQIGSMRKARQEAATSKTSMQKLISNYILTRIGVRSK